MKYFKMVILLFLAALVLYGCDSPAPTELVPVSQNQNLVQVQVIAKDTANVYYDNGFDTTGLAQQPLEYSNFITVTGTKVTEDGITRASGYARVLLFDTSNPIKGPGGKILGYMTRKLNFKGMKLMFDDIPAVEIPYKLKYKYHGTIMDTVLGQQYILVDNGNASGKFKYKYNSHINFHMVLNNKNVNFKIPTPSEITENIELTGHLANKNLNAIVQWNGQGSSSLILIIGAITKKGNAIYPLYQLQLQDNGSLTVPSELLNEIPQNTYSKFVFTLVRKIETQESGGDTNLYVLSQSIHSIILDIP